ncbi:hypothetical protein PF008_g19732 [Phytophthora fragariae]|uniref:Uncharacterized protein n=1 Tax=Phytophthora fragariae TaxID=53985 RepID=A0A6G0R2T6_9STRA|nr:hypothetical protein PF008_g19732 [Phytophthora fragariae]
MILRGRSGSRSLRDVNNRRAAATDIPGVRDVRVGRVAAHLLVGTGSQHIRALGRQLRGLRALLRGARFLGSCLAADFSTEGFFGAGFEEAVTFLYLRVGFEEADAFFTFDFVLVASAVSFLEAGGFIASSAPIACFVDAGDPFASSVSFACFLEADASFVPSGSPELFVEAGAGGFPSSSLGAGASA